MNKSLTVVFALAVGFVGGILLAPKSGKDMREDLMKKREDIQDRAQKGFETVKRSASSIKDEMKSSAKDVIDIAAEPTR